MLEDAILELKSGGGERREEFTPQINVEAPILIPEAYVPDLDLRMGLYRRLGELEDRQGCRGLRRGADRPLRQACRRRPRTCCKSLKPRSIAGKAMIAKLDVGAKGAVVTFRPGGFPDLRRPAGLCRPAEGRGQAAARQQAGDQPRLADRRRHG